MYTYNKLPTKIHGLLFEPEITNYPNDSDPGPGNHPYRFCTTDNTDRNLELLDELIRDFPGGNVMEIGVARNPDFSRTFTSKFFKYDKFKYIGVDLEPRPIIKELNTNAEFIQSDSTRVEDVINKLKGLGIYELSILFIDGWHSMNTVIQDWRYTELVKPEGMVIFHDTNHHPGPMVLLDAIDPERYKITKYFVDCYDDHGMSVALKK